MNSVLRSTRGPRPAVKASQATSLNKSPKKTTVRKTEQASKFKSASGGDKKPSAAALPFTVAEEDTQGSWDLEEALMRVKELEVAVAALNEKAVTTGAAMVGMLESEKDREIVILRSELEVLRSKSRTKEAPRSGGLPSIAPFIAEGFSAFGDALSSARPGDAIPSAAPFLASAFSTYFASSTEAGPATGQASVCMA